MANAYDQFDQSNPYDSFDSANVFDQFHDSVAVAEPSFLDKVGRFIFGSPPKQMQAFREGKTLPTEEETNPSATKSFESPLVSAETIKPYIDLGQLASMFPAIEEELKGVGEGIASGAASMTSPQNLSLLATGALGKTAQIVMAAGFEAQAIKNAPDQWKAYSEATDPKEKAKILTEMALGLGVPVVVAGHISLGKSPAVQEKSVPSLPEADVSTQLRAAPPTIETRPLSPVPETVAPAPIENRSSQPEPTLSDAQRLELIRQALSEEAGAATAPEGTTPKTALDQPQDVPQATITDPKVVEDVGATTGVAQRLNETRAQEGQIGDIQPGEGISRDEAVQIGRDMKAQGADPYAVAEKVGRGEPVSPEEFSLLRAHSEDLGRATQAALEASEVRPFDLGLKALHETARTQETAFLQNAVKPVSTMWHKMGMGHQGEVDLSTGNFVDLRRQFTDTHGKAPDLRESRILKGESSRIQKANDDATQAMQKAFQAVEQKMRARSKTAPRSTEQLREHFGKRLRELTPC